ncbi:hypothetical protein PACTADRAFT_51857, partial [Pachysolen tannophilus NRRL Y-2460]
MNRHTEQTSGNLRQRSAYSEPISTTKDFDPDVSPNQLSEEEIKKEMETPLSFKDALGLLCILVPLGLFVWFQGYLYSKQSSGKAPERNLFMDFLGSLVNDNNENNVENTN